MSKNLRLILASGSEQRREIFDMIGWKYEIIKSDVDEISTSKQPSKYVKELSKQKADAVAKIIKENAIIVSADTVIFFDGKIYEKPKSKNEARENLKKMSGKVTEAITGVTVIDLYNKKEIQFADSAKVEFNKISKADIDWYVENDKNILSRCGYSVKGKAALFLKRVDGDHNTLFGISPSKLYSAFKKLGYKASDFEVCR